jgi:lysine 2-monooxygenase
MRAKADAMSRDILDVAIVGGGVSGCYCGYRLLTADPAIPALQDMLRASGSDSLSVALFEASDRIGGRLWSHRFPETPSLVAEMGGIGFSPLHANVYGLCTKELSLKTEPADEFKVINLQYFRAHRYAFSDYKPDPRWDRYYPEIVPFFLTDEEKRQFPTDLMLAAFVKAVPDVRALLHEFQIFVGNPDKALAIIAKLDAILRTARTTGTGLPLYDCGFWDLLSQNASQEAYDMVTLSSGFYSNTQNWNAYNLLLGATIDFSVVQDWTKLKDGYDALPKEMVRRFKELGGEVHTGTRLLGLEPEGRGASAVLGMRLQSQGTVQTQLARNVILALPQRSVRLLIEDTFLARQQKFLDDLGTVTCEPASKLFLTFAEPWWRKVPTPPGQTEATIQRGQSATDLPMRLCYYLGTEENGRSLLLASFTDSIGVEYWNGYLPHGRYRLSDRGAGPTPLLFDPPDAMIADIVRQLGVMHEIDVPAPLSAKFVNWSGDPYGGGYHFWNTHVRSWEVMPRIRRPAPDANVFLCGEAFSAKQGWVEGAINTAEMTLETYFGLPRPEWAPKDYDFGA